MVSLVQTNFDLNTLGGLASEILKESLIQGATSAEVDIAVNKGFSVTARQGDVESIEYHQDKIIELTVYIGQRLGAVSLSDLRPAAIHSAVKAACNIARYTDSDPHAGLAHKDELAFNYPPLDLSYPWDLSVPDAIEIVKKCEAEAMAKDKRISNSEGASLSTTNGWHVYGNTHGFIGGFPASRHEISCVLIATQGEEMQRDFSYTIHCDATKLMSIDNLANEAARRTVRRLGARSLSTRKVPVIFAAEEARGLLKHFVSAISGSNLYRKSSFLVDHLGRSIFPAHITIEEHPHWTKSLGSSPFDSDGVSTRPNCFIKDGILTSYVLGVYSARKLGLKTTGNADGVHNLVIKTGEKDLAQLLKTMGTGLFVTELMGQGVNVMTGDYSRGAAGFWVENGVIQYPVEEITIASNLREMYAGIVEVGKDIDTRGNIQTGSILIENMMVAGN